MDPRPSRIPLATALFTAPWGLLIANAGYAWATRNGGSDETGAGALALAAAHPTLLRTGVLAGMVGALLMVPAALGTGQLIGDRARRLGFVSATLVAAGYICYFAVINMSMVTLAMAHRGGPLADYAAVLDAAENNTLTAWVFLLFVAGNLLGTFLLALALLRGRVVPVWAAVAVMAWPVLHVTGLIAGTEWFEVAGAFLQGIGFAVVGARLVRRPTDRPAEQPVAWVTAGSAAGT
jgi:hypothetical protein